jgi:hypothetical protein
VEPQRDMSLSVVYTIYVLIFICDSTSDVSESFKPRNTLSVATTEFSTNGILIFQMSYGTLYPEVCIAERLQSDPVPGFSSGKIDPSTKRQRQKSLF